VSPAYREQLSRRSPQPPTGVARTGIGPGQRWVVVGINRIVGFLVLALILFFIITQPRSAANVVQSLGSTLREAAESITVFFREVV
jgi:hypothetical protein